MKTLGMYFMVYAIVPCVAMGILYSLILLIAKLGEIVGIWNVLDF